MNLLTQNKKMKKSGSQVYNFGIPAVKTCPNAGDCLKGCYATQGAYRFSNVRPAFERRWELSKGSDFPDLMHAEIVSKRPSRVRIHDSGDFYSAEYLSKWCIIAEQHPDVEFYAYTKMVSMVKMYEAWLPENLTVIFSYGGTEDALIDPDKDRHSKVYTDIDTLLGDGYIDASDDDSLALTDNPKVGLVYHGAMSRTWGIV